MLRTVYRVNSFAVLIANLGVLLESVVPPLVRFCVAILLLLSLFFS